MNVSASISLMASGGPIEIETMVSKSCEFANVRIDQFHYDGESGASSINALVVNVYEVDRLREIAAAFAKAADELEAAQKGAV